MGFRCRFRFQAAALSGRYASISNSNISYADVLAWEVEYADEFGDWYESLGNEDRDAVIARVELLEQGGPGLGRPSVDNIHQSRHAHMKELRAERAIRVLFAFDPRRTAILLIGGSKHPDESTSANWNEWYDEFVPKADDLYDAHLQALQREGLI